MAELAGEGAEGLPPVDEELAKLLEGQAYSLNFVVSCARSKDCPIVYASDGFYRLTGYSPEETIGRNCRFLQGERTQHNKVTAIRDALREERAVTVTLLNYKKDGTELCAPFFLWPRDYAPRRPLTAASTDAAQPVSWNCFHMAPVADDAGRTVWYVGVQTEVSAAVAAELQSGCFGVAGLPGSGPEALPRADPAAAAQAVALKQLLSEAAAEESRVLHAAPAPGALVPMAHAPGTAESVNPSLLRSLVKIQQSFCLSDPSLPDCPIVHASQGFLTLTGYPPELVLGRSCRFLQGKDTSRAAVAALAAGIRAAVPTTARLLNYRFDGTPFWNSVHVAPVRDASGNVVMFVGVQVDVTAEVAEQEAAEMAAADAAADDGEGDAATEAGGGAAEGSALSIPEPAPPPKGALPAGVAQMGAVGAVRVAVRGLGSGALKRHDT